MTPREKASVIGGMLLGIAAAAAGFVIFNREDTVTAPAVPTPAATTMAAQEPQRIPIETMEVRRQNITEKISAIGRVQEPETAIREVSARIGGRIDRLFINYTGQAVRAGDPVAEIYSPEIVTAAEEYKLALENRKHLAASPQPAAIAQAGDLVTASRRRLELWGLTPEQIDLLLAAPETPIHITIFSSATGIVRTRNVTQGQYVNAGDTLVDVIDLSTIWVAADVFQTDISRIRNGLRAQITSDALPGATLTGAVTFIEPNANPESRTTPVRIQVTNPGMRLRPGMFVNVSFDISLGINAVAVPRNAVIDSGTEKTVYVAQPDGSFERRVVQTGSAGADYYPVTSGLKEGERVVTNGAFLIDSQSRLSGGAMSGMFGGSTSFAGSTAASASKHQITYRIEPDPPRGAQESTVHVRVADAAGNAINDAQVRMTIIMPAMPSMGMPEMRNSAELKWNGSEYVGPITIGMAGSWNVVIEARRGAELLAAYQTRLDAK